MAKGNNIIVTSPDSDRRKEGIIAGTPKPGTVMAIVADTSPDGTGAFTWEPYGTTAAASNNGVAADGDKRVIAILDADWDQGKTVNDAYADGARGFLYFPNMGEQFNMILEDVAGTGDDHIIGDLFMVDDGTGKLIATDNDAQSEPFQILEAYTDPVEDKLAWVMYTGY
jgi:hypothetical protein